MNFDAIVRNDSTDKLKCSECKNYLSRFPISLSNKINMGSFCGRCVTPDETSYLQDVAFEHICQYLQFPCQYKEDGCTVKMYPKDVPQHEDHCQFRPVLCVLDKECAWSGFQSDLLNHVQRKHYDIFLKNGIFNVGLSKCFNPVLRKYLFVWSNVLYIFETMFTPETSNFQCALYTSQLDLNLKTLSCQLNAKICNKSVLLKFNSSTFDEKEFSEISFESLRTGSENTIECEISICDNKTVKSVEKTVEKDIISGLMCSLCRDFVIPPIYCCVHKQQIFCRKCFWSHRLTCSGCNQDKASTSHFHLDTIAGLLDYPCKNQRNGCTYVSKPDQIETHLSECEFGDVSCVLDTRDSQVCSWKGPLHSIRPHFEKCHQMQFFFDSLLIRHSFEIGKKRGSIISFGNHLFLLVYAKVSEEYRWGVKVIGQCVDNFLYEIEIIDVNGRRRLSTIKKCLFWQKTNSHHPDRNDYCCYFKNDQLSHLLDSQGRLAFKIRIFNTSS